MVSLYAKVFREKMDEFKNFNKKSSDVSVEGKIESISWEVLNVSFHSVLVVFIIIMIPIAFGPLRHEICITLTLGNPIQWMDFLLVFSGQKKTNDDTERSQLVHGQIRFTCQEFLLVSKCSG